jgi:peroxiredoxin
MMRDFQFCSSKGHSVLLSDCRQHSNMVRVFTSKSPLSAELLSEPKVHRPDLAEKETRIPVIVPGSLPRAAELKRALHLDLRIVVDVDGRVHRSMAADDQSGHILPAVFVTDRFGEVFAAYKSVQNNKLLDIEEILSWIDFISRPSMSRCGPLEWPD